MLGVAIGMASGKPSVVGNSKIVLCLLGFTILYQIAYQFFMHRALVDREEIENHCEVGAFASSPQCLELHLFQNWRDADFDDFDNAQPALLKSFPRIDHVVHDQGHAKAKEEVDSNSRVHIDEGKLVLSPAGAKNLRGTRSGHIDSWGQFDKLYHDTLASLHNKSPLTPWSKSVVASQSSLESLKRAQPIAKTSAIQKSDDHGRGEFDRIYSDTLASLNRSTMTAWGESVRASQVGLQSLMEALPSTRLHQREERESRFNALYQEALTSIQGRSNVTRWSTELKALEESYDKRLRKLSQTKKIDDNESHDHSVLDKVYRETLATLHRSSMTSWGENLRASQAEMESRMQALITAHPLMHSGRANFSEELAEHDATLNSSFAELHASHDRWLQNFSNTIDNYTRELCADPRRRNLKVCASFLRSGLNFSVGTGQISDTNTASVSVASEENVDATPRALRGTRVRGSEFISWPQVAASFVAADRMADGLGVVAVTREELGVAKWREDAPKVACITAVPVGQDSRVRLLALLKDFREQTYEGTRQLVLVYSPEDGETAKLVRSSADGKSIKAVAARDGMDPLSTVALRYGAWSSDADIIASWRFDEVHHQNRLAMQVRALGLASRPVSILKQWTLLSENGRGQGEVVSADPGWEGSLVGEKSWMHKHWMPLLGNERHMFHGSLAGQLVQVDMPELSVYTARGPHALADARLHFGIA